MQKTVLISPKEEKTYSKTLTNAIDKSQKELLEESSYAYLLTNLDKIDSVKENSTRILRTFKERIKIEISSSKIPISQYIIQNLTDIEFKINDFEDRETQTLVKDNSLENKPRILTLSEAITSLRNSVEIMKKDEQEFNKEEYKRLDETFFYNDE